MTVSRAPDRVQGWIVVALLVIIAGAALVPSSRPRFEYRATLIPAEQLKETLDLSGDTGWEIVSFSQTVPTSDSDINYVILLKRRR